MYSKIQWLPVVYTKDKCGTIVPKKRSLKQLCYISVSIDFFILFSYLLYSIGHVKSSELSCMDWQSICIHFCCY